MAECIFCKIVAGSIPCHRIYEDEKTLAFMDINPLTKGHSLVIPKNHCNDVFDMTEEDARAVILTAKRVAIASVKGLGAAGVNLLNSNGRVAGQEVLHYHMHVVPRYAGDGIKLFPVSRYKESDPAGTCVKIKNSL